MSLAQRAVIVQHPHAPRPRLAPTIQAAGLRLHLDESVPTDPREQRVLSRNLEALDAAERERQQFLEMLPNEAARDEYRARWAASDCEKQLRAVRACADAIGLHLFGCRSEVMPTDQRERLLVATERLLGAIQ